VSDKTIGQMTAEVVDFCKRKGWYDEDVPFPQSMVLLHSEVTEAFEAWRQWGLADMTGDCHHESAADLAHKPEGVGSEFADILIRLLDDCARYGVDLGAEYERKMAYNETRAYRWAKV
jgi:NTP pyrophosphatase (non-canonical NTP hydrolase)